MVECPYCEKENEVNHDDGYGYEEGIAYNQRCSYCHKTFVYYTTISFYHESVKAPCKNGGEHKLTEICGAPAAFFKFKRMCEYCETEIIIDEEAHKKSIKNYYNPINK